VKIGSKNIFSCSARIMWAVNKMRRKYMGTVLTIKFNYSDVILRLEIFIQSVLPVGI
jgi:hypothetical protein